MAGTRGCFFVVFFYSLRRGGGGGKVLGGVNFFRGCGRASIWHITFLDYFLLCRRLIKYKLENGHLTALSHANLPK